MYKLIGIVIFIPILSAAATEVYIWQDGLGITHYSQYPPEGMIAERHILSEPGRHASRPSATVEARQQPAQSQLQPSSEREKLDMFALRYCKNARYNHKILTTHQRVRRTDHQAATKVLSDKERQEQLNLAQRQIELFCPKNTSA